VIRIWIGGLLWIACTLVGIGIGTSYKKRAKFFKEWNEFCIVMNNSVKNLKIPQSKIIEKFVMDKSGQFVEFLKEYNQYLQSQIKESQTLDNLVKKAPLFKKENKYLRDFFDSLGTVDYNLQVDILKYQTELVEHLEQVANKEYKTNGMLWYKLGFVLGLVIMILVV